MIAYFAPLSTKTPADYAGAVIDGGTLIERLAAMIKCDVCIVLVQDDDMQFIAQYHTSLMHDQEDLELSVMLNAPGVNYAAPFVLASQILGRSNFDDVIAANRSTRAIEHAERDDAARTFPGHVSERRNPALTENQVFARRVLADAQEEEDVREMNDEATATY